MNKWNNIFINIYKKNQNTVNIFLLVILTIIVFYNSLNSYFFEADDLNLLLHTKSSISQIFLTNTYGSNSGGNYRPLEKLSHMIDLYLFGDDNLFGRHLINIIIHMLNVILIYIICSWLTKNKTVGLIAGLLFTTFIINSHSLAPVTWISGRSDLLVTFFYLTSLTIFIKSISKGSLLYYLSSVIAFLFGLLSKEMAITLPFIILAYLILFSDESTGKNIFNKKHLFVILGILFLTGIIVIFFAILFNPDFIARNLSRHGVLSLTTINKIDYLRHSAIWGGSIITVISGLILLLSNFSNKISDFLFFLRYSIPYFFVLLIFLIVRFIIVGGFGGAYNVPEGNVILKYSADTFARDIYALAALIWPVGSGYNIEIYKLQIEHNFLFYAIFILFSLIIILLLIKLISSKSRLLTFSFLWIYITLIPAHNSILPSWQFQARYLYLPSIGFCILVSFFFYKLVKNKYISYSISKFSFTAILCVILIMNSLLIIKHNERLKKNGEIMQRFVSDMRGYQSVIHDSTNLTFISFPLTPISSASNVYIYAYMDDVLNFIYNRNNYNKEFNYNIISYVDGETADTYNVIWLNEKSFIIERINPSKNYLIPNEPALFDKQIKNIYKISPHPLLQKLPPKGESGIYRTHYKNSNLTKISTLQLDKEDNAVKLKVELMYSLDRKPYNNVFFIYENGHFRLLEEFLNDEKNSIIQ